LRTGITTCAHEASIHARCANGVIAVVSKWTVFLAAARHQHSLTALLAIARVCARRAVAWAIGACGETQVEIAGSRTDPDTIAVVVVPSHTAQASCRIVAI